MIPPDKRQSTQSGSDELVLQTRDSLLRVAQTSWSCRQETVMHGPGGREQATTLNNISSVMLDLVTDKRHAWTWWTRASCAPPRRAGSMSPSARQTHQPHPDMKFRHICVNRLMQAREPSCGRASRLAGERTALWARRRSVLGWHAAERKGGRNVGAGKQRKRATRSVCGW